MLRGQWFSAEDRRATEVTMGVERSLSGIKLNKSTTIAAWTL